jgi:predicted nucleotidyltransferase
MQSTHRAVRKKCYGSVTVYWLDRVALREQVRRATEELGAARPEVRRVVLFGSVAAGTATAGSDVDIMIEVSDTSLPLLERPEAYAGAFSLVELPVELFVYTSEELRCRPPAVAESAERNGLVIYAADNF